MASLRRVQQKTASALERAPIPEASSTRRPPSFHGYDSEDVNRWLDKLENYLMLRRIDTASPTALAELVMCLAGPAEDFYYSLPVDQKGNSGLGQFPDTKYALPTAGTVEATAGVTSEQELLAKLLNQKPPSATTPQTTTKDKNILAKLEQLLHKKTEPEEDTILTKLEALIDGKQLKKSKEQRERLLLAKFEELSGKNASTRSKHS
ncbi:hypothetical protein OS493_000728 [Desmophyllum pertusum]|uniref:Uncharacterized protein n=1 Tax=Desmophyllum pertusum TaxID=174260 RepID=A0A9X0A7K9_9CNID|nr:hypothetical protein OS493_000728 [Desmophyllum pertusum]